MFTPWKKYNKAVKKWEGRFDEANNELSSRVNEIERYKSPTDDDTREFIESKDTLKSAIEKTISKAMKGDLQTEKTETKKDADGRCTIRCGGRLVAYSYSYDKAKEIEKTLRDIIDDKKVRELLKKGFDDFKEMIHLEQLFKIKLAWRVETIRLWDFILPFRKEGTYPRDLEAAHAPIVIKEKKRTKEGGK
jgi:hypothetical protein